MLGSDITGKPATMVNDPNSWGVNQNFVQQNTTTTYLVAAGAPAFDRNCQAPDVATAVANNCSTVSTFGGCGTGCGVNPVQEELWAALGQFGTYNTTQWQR